jgi:NADH:ubiquinone oxidoreductase subunit E
MSATAVGAHRFDVEILRFKLSERSGVDFCEQTPDGALRLKPLRCREIPSTSSTVMVDDEVFEISTLVELEELLDSLVLGHSSP